MSASPIDPRQCWFLSGPTASGKSAVALELAQILGAEIISLDSMAVFRGMDLGTAKPRAEERGRVPHHLIDIVEPTEDYSLASYLADAQRVVAEVLARNKLPLFVGGTPLYLKSLLRGIFEGPPADWPLRRELEQFGQQAGDAALHARLAAVDPASAARLAPTDRRRVVRALEVFQKTGQSITQLQQQFDRPMPQAECHVFVLDWPRPQLVERIDRRVDWMFHEGLVDEVSRLLETHGSLSRTAGQALGYREVIEHLIQLRNLPDTIDLVKTRTRQFAKRQMTWFRSLSECRWLAVDGAVGPPELAATIAQCRSAQAGHNIF